MRQYALAPFLAGLASVVLAAELPPPAPPGSTPQERLYLASGSADDIALLAARVECVAFQRARIEARLADGVVSQGWNHAAQGLWRLHEALSRFEAAHIRPHVDRDTQQALIDTYAPDGFDLAAETEEGADRARRCQSFGDAGTLRRLAG
jgi:hypothetical protein